jgi:pyocin large subunit-like protein
MSDSTQVWAWLQKLDRISDKVVLVYLACHASATLECEVSISTMAEAVGATKATIRQSLKELYDRGLINIRRGHVGGLYQTNVYLLHCTQDKVDGPCNSKTSEGTT